MWMNNMEWSATNSMEWGAYENRVAIVALHHCGMPPTKIVKTLTPLAINKRLIFSMLSRNKETNDVSDRPRSGWPRVARTKEVVCVVCAHVMRNPFWKQKILAREMQIAKTPSVQTLHKTFINHKIERDLMHESHKIVGVIWERRLPWYSFHGWENFWYWGGL